MSAPPPEHVRAAFGVPGHVAQPFTGGRGTAYRCGPVVLKPVSDAAETSSLAGVFEKIWVPGVRIARPVRSMDGRWVVSGWTAHRFVAGKPAPRFEEIIGVGHALHSALASVPRPRFLDQRDPDDLWVWADRVAWGETAAGDRIGDGVGATAFAGIASGRRPVDLTVQLIHGDLTGNVLFAGDGLPAVIDITPYWRPPMYATAIVVVDAVAWGGADLALAGRSEPGWRQVLRRALLFRLAVSLAHPASTPASMVGVLSAAERLTPVLEECDGAD